MIIHQSNRHGIDSAEPASAPGYQATGDRDLSGSSSAVFALCTTEGA